MPVRNSFSGRPIHQSKFSSGLLIAIMIWASAAFASDVVQPPRGDPLRTTLLDTVRPVFEMETGGSIEFVVKRLAVQGDWSFGHVVLQRPGGKPINWNKTKFAADLREGFFDPASSFFLLQKSEKGWRVYDHAIGPTDVAWDGWRQELGLSMDLFSSQ